MSTSRVTAFCSSLVAIIFLAAGCGEMYEGQPEAPEEWEGAASSKQHWAGPGAESSPWRCTDGVDNDGDGYKDCKDFDCRWLSFCDAVEDSPGECGDGVDNDGDGYTDCQDFGCQKQVFCRGATVRVASFNVQYLGSSSSTGFAALADIIKRVSADVMCLQEVKSWESSRFVELAKQTGYAHHFQGKVSTPMAGGITNACLSRLPLVQGRSRSSDDISSSAWANETGRDIVTVRVRLPNGRHLLVVNAHLKSGFGDDDRVRRQVEALRVRDLLRQHRKVHPGDAEVVLGDFNEIVNGSNLGRVYTKAPYGMPWSYKLGADISYPITYDPFATFKAEKLTLTRPTHEDSTTNFATRIPSGKRIDFILFRGADLLGDEVYEACVDNGVDDGPKGNYLAKKSGKPLPCGTNKVASDHRPVFADLRVR